MCLLQQELRSLRNHFTELMCAETNEHPHWIVISHPAVACAAHWHVVSQLRVSCATQVGEKANTPDPKIKKYV